MTFDLPRAVEILQRTPAVLRALLQDLDDEWTLTNYGEKTFSPFDVVGHLIHGERADWIPRLRIILEHGESQPFEPFDRYAMYESSKGKTMNELLDTFAELRAKSLDDLRCSNLSPHRFELRGTHPALGTVTLKNLLATWVAHDLGHIHQIVKSMAYQYRDEVGPWRDYITILPPR